MKTRTFDITPILAAKYGGIQEWHGKCFPPMLSMDNLYHVGGKYGETLREECQEIKFISLKDFVTALPSE